MHWDCGALHLAPFSMRLTLPLWMLSTAWLQLDAATFGDRELLLQGLRAPSGIIPLQHLAMQCLHGERRGTAFAAAFEQHALPLLLQRGVLSAQQLRSPDEIAAELLAEEDAAAAAAEHKAGSKAAKRQRQKEKQRQAAAAAAEAADVAAAAGSASGCAESPAALQARPAAASQQLAAGGAGAADADAARAAPLQQAQKRQGSKHRRKQQASEGQPPPPPQQQQQGQHTAPGARGSQQGQVRVVPGSSSAAAAAPAPQAPAADEEDELAEMLSAMGIGSREVAAGSSSDGAAAGPESRQQAAPAVPVQLPAASATRAAAEAAGQLLDSFTCPITQVGLGQAPASKCAHARVAQERYGHTAFELLCCLPFTGLPAPRCLACAGTDD